MKNDALGYKQTSFGFIPIDWEVKKLGDLGKVISGLTYSPDDICEESGTLVLRSSNVQDGQIKLGDNVYVKVKTGEYNPVNKQDILICVRNGSKSLIGKNALITEEAAGMAFGAFMAIYRSDFNNYLYQIFNTDIYYREIHKNLGATINSINGSDLKEIKIPIPPLPEQNKIVSILSTWDKAIDNCKGIVDNLKNRNNGLSQQLLSGKMRVKGFEKSKWTLVSINRFAKDSSTKNPIDKELIVLSCTKHNGLVPSLEYFGRKIYSDDLTTYKIVSKGQFAYATNHIEEGSIGYQSEYDEALISPMYTVFQTNETVNDNFLFRVLKSSNYIHEYQKRMEGSIDRRGGLRWNEFSKIKVPVPEIKEQIAINEILDKATEELKQYQDKLQTLQLQKKGLMQQLLTGKVRVETNNYKQ
ncbi:restriction endonuclease subunit S [Flavobacterium luteum]|uniref:Restriction endonuclease subunit S n=1 Tax=Flavobacterium luteum TaxID=2026654 RepID=A0A7J5AK01_9FLAO|nr:restriction endonuclease subunit S [Flavobacterium luteum]KAB1157932.1 restriction endonuclease subunit S [Flavobacterium luteum]